MTVLPPLPVAERLRVTDVDLVKEAALLMLIELVGATELGVTVIVSVPVLPALSVAVTLIVLAPLERVILSIFQAVVPDAEYVPVLPLLYQVMLFIPELVAPSSEASPASAILKLVEVYSSAFVGLVILTTGFVVSKVIVSLVSEDTLPAESLYQT